MPTVLGNFISRYVYGSELQTEHNAHTETCCRFVDVSDGKESKNGRSWVVRLPSRDANPSFVTDICLPLRTKEKSKPP